MLNFIFSFSDMSMTGENVDVTLSSSTESPKEHEKNEETPTSRTETKKRKGKKPVEASPTKGGKRKKTSATWDHFKEIVGDKDRAKCIYCAAKISCSTANGTNAMKRHTNRCKKAPFNLDKTQTILDFESKTKCNTDGTIETISVPKLWRFDQEQIRQALAKMVIMYELPFSFVEREGFRMFCKVAIPDFVPPSRGTITKDCYALFIEKRRTLKNFFSNLSSRVCLTTDTWTSAQNLSYMCLTAHFIDDAWKLHKKIINFFPIVGHSGELIARAVEKCLQEWDLKKILTVTVDNASSNDLAIKYLKQILNLWDGSMLNGEFLHMRCAAHILNLVVKDGLKDVDASVTRVRAAVKYVRSSPERLQKFQSCVKEENIDSKALVCLDVETRWNSTYSMLKIALVFKKAFRNLKTKYLPYTKKLRKVGGAPDDEDWDKVSSFLPFLEIFYETTLSFSGSRYVTGNTFVEQIYDIGYTINRYVDDLQSSDGLRSMARQMKLKFDKYWANVNNLNVLMFITLVLDPRHKLRYVEWIVRRSYDPSNSYVLCQRIKDVLTSLFDFYAFMQPSSTQKTPCSANPTSSGQDGKGGIRKLKGTNLRKDYVTKIESADTFETMTELDRYLGDKCASESDDFDILVWWSM
ncbi:DAYSLEEPER [Hibiscus trionum]|uniref:DAYSLEEPER n=1 Tax=Hibiscus trionum TaxID=183268 RepID=A0A9W7GRZ5_HIBTR|nr:DAYSLEEPER [Hibiscus trionum]